MHPILSSILTNGCHGTIHLSFHLRLIDTYRIDRTPKITSGLLTQCKKQPITLLDMLKKSAYAPLPKVHAGCHYVIYIPRSVLYVTASQAIVGGSGIKSPPVFKKIPPDFIRLK
jgi:hypothetical protein